MKRINPKILVAISIISFPSCSDKETQQVDKNYVITGEVTGFPEGTKIYLKNLSTDANIDSTNVSNNSFVLRGHLEDPPEQLWLTSQLEDKFLYTNLLMGNDSIKVKADINDFPWDVQKEGSEIQEEYTKARNRTRKYDRERDSLTSYFMSLNEEERQKQGKEIWTRIDKIDSITSAKKLEYLKSNDSYTSVIDLGYLKNKLPRDTVKKIFLNYSEGIKNSKYGNVIKVYLNNKTITIGDFYYDFEGINQENKKIYLSSIHENNKYTLIDFTSTFCGPCIQAAEELVSIQQSYKDSLNIVSFSGDPKKEWWLKGVERDRVTWNSIWDGKGRFSETAIIYGVSGFPTFILIDPQGKVVDKWTGYSKGNLRDRIDKFL